MCVKQLEEGRAEVENQYVRSVVREGNKHAQEIVSQIFLVISRKWRGIGEISQSGLGMKTEYEKFDAEKKFDCAECADGGTSHREPRQQPTQPERESEVGKPMVGHRDSRVGDAD